MLYTCKSFPIVGELLVASSPMEGKPPDAFLGVPSIQLSVTHYAGYQNPFKLTISQPWSLHYQEKVRNFKIKLKAMKNPGILLLLANFQHKWCMNLEKSNICL